MKEGKLDDKALEKSKQQEIDLLKLGLKIWVNRKFVLKASGIAVIIGLIVAFSIPKVYETKVKMAPEISGKSSISGNLSSLAAMAGINLGGVVGEDAISPELYPNIVSSTPFLVELFKVNVVTKDGKLNTTLYNYMLEHQKLPWWSYITSIPFKVLRWVVLLFKEEDLKGDINSVDAFRLTKEQNDIANAIKGNISSSVDKKTNVITLVVHMQDPLISASLADTVTSKLQQYIVNYRTNKARQDLIFAEKLYKEAKADYYKAQQTYAAYTDGNMNVVMARYKTEAERLQNEMNLAYTVYNQVAQQLQIVKAKVQEITPVYTVVQPPSVPLLASSPNKILILIGFVLFAAFGAITWILFKDWLAGWKK